ncbi:MAG: 2-phospho-L-lactate transferase CofD family protein, partial [Desulfobulbaceae bacterium]|nr:2-phospho-L-lactate transferase CofD family protein [Desulfobulbaceae bacterium]
MVLLQRLFSDRRLSKALNRPHCLGNLLILSAIYARVEGEPIEVSPNAIRDGLHDITSLIGVPADAVLPCACTPSVLKMRYANGVVVTGESKVATAHRGVPVEQVMVDYVRPDPRILPEVLDAIRQADIILYAPGSLYTSIVPVMQTPGLAQAVRENDRAMKLLVANLWVQAGETDLATDDSGRRYYVSDLITAYHQNIPGGVQGLFGKILLLAMQEIPGNIIQSYAVEGKTPIYLDRVKVWNMGFSPIEASIFSRQGLLDRKVRHDPVAFATAIKVLWAVNGYLDQKEGQGELALSPAAEVEVEVRSTADVPCQRYGRILETLGQLSVRDYEQVGDIVWRHPDIPVSHLQYLHGVTIVDQAEWKRDQYWDNLYSFYDPSDSTIKICRDLVGRKQQFEVAFLAALGQSLLGNFALSKEVQPLLHGGEILGKVYHLILRPLAQRRCFFSEQELFQYLLLARMRQSVHDPYHFTRVVNGDEGFTPPGLLMGLTYAWYLDNRFS